MSILMYPGLSLIIPMLIIGIKLSNIFLSRFGKITEKGPAQKHLDLTWIPKRPSLFHLSNDGSLLLRS